MALFLVPASEANLRTSIEPPLASKVVETLLPEDQMSALGRAGAGKDGFRCWAMTEGKESTWKRMKPGDVVLFSVRGTGEFRYVGEVAHTLQSRRFGDAVWPFQKNKPWEFVYFLVNVERIKLAKRDLVTRLGYKPNFEVQGATYVKPERLESILQLHRSVVNWISALQSGTEPPPPTRNETQTSRVADVEKHEPARSGSEIVAPFWLTRTLEDVLTLKKDASHQERAHESIVETFYEALGYRRFAEIRHRQGRIDISIQVGDQRMIVNEVKRDWNLSWRSNDSAVDQAFRYASRVGARFAILTNGDYYAVFDRKRGLSIDENFAGEFRLSELTKSDLDLIERLSRSRMLEES